MACFLSESANRIVHLLSGREKEARTVHIPLGHDGKDGLDQHIGNGESLQEWLGHVVECTSDTIRFEENMVLFGVVKWTQEGLYFVNLQAVTTENGDIDDFILKKPNVLGHYFRLDLDLDKPGPLFKEPLPHIHTRPIREPRFSLPLTSSKTCIVDFLEFLYLNFHYDKWRNWAKSIWLSQNPLQEEGVFDAMGEAYAKGKTDWLRDKYAIKIEELRACLLKEKQDISERMAPVSVFARQLKY